MIPSKPTAYQDHGKRTASVSSNPSPFLKAMQSLSSNSISEGGRSICNITTSGISEELSWTAKKVNWIRGGSIYRSFSYPDQGQDILQALFVWFELPESNLEFNIGNSNSILNSFGPFQKISPPSWTDDPLPLPTQPTSTLSSPKLVRTRSLVIFLEDIAFIYPTEGGGGSFPVQIPFRLHQAWAMDLGVLLERAPEGKERGEGDLATLYSLLDPKAEIKVVSYTSELSGLFGEGTEESKPKREIPTNPIQDLNERIVFSSSRKRGEDPIFVSANRVSGQVSIWSYGRIDLEEEISIIDALEEASESGKAKGKGNAMDLDESMSNSNSIDKPTTIKRKRSSFAPNQSTSILASRRVSAGGIGSTSISGPSGGGLPSSTEESDLLEVLGETMGIAMKRTASALSAMSAAERRGSVTRNELSITLDRMALGGSAGAAGLAISGEMDREATLYFGDAEESRMASDVLVERIWSIELGKDSPQSLDNMEVHMFDTKSSTSSLAILLPQSSTLLLLTLSHIEKGRIGITPLHQASAIAASPVLYTRNDILDLIFVSPDEQWVNISAQGRMEVLPTPSVIGEGKKVVKIEGDGSNEIIITLDDGCRKIARFEAELTVPALTCMRAIAAVTTFDTFYNFQKAVSTFHLNYQDTTYLDCIFLLLGNEVLETKDTPKDPILAGLRSSSTKSSSTTFKTFPPGETRCDLTGPEREIIFLALHLLTEEMKLSSETMEIHQELIVRMTEMAVRLGLRTWIDYYLRLSGFISSIHKYNPSENVLIPTQPVSIVQMLASTLIKLPIVPFLHDINGLAAHFNFIPSEFYGTIKICPLTIDLIKVYSHLSIQSSESTTVRSQAAVLEMYKLGWTREYLKTLAFGIAVPLWEAIRLCQLEAPENWETGAYELIRRNDLAGKTNDINSEKVSDTSSGSLPTSISAVANGGARAVMGIDEGTIKHSKAVRFGEDRRLEEVERMLQYEHPVSVNGGDRSLEQLTSSVQQGILLSLSNRTLSLPIGHAMFSYRTKNSSPTETIPITPINLSARILPMSSIVNLHEKERTDGAAKEIDRSEWPDFHSGVKAALELGAEGEFDSSSITFNRPGVMTAGHGGFLMGLGLMGSISGILLNQAFEYLKVKHDPTSIGLLLGLATTYIGTGDEKLTSLLSVHLAALHPKNSSTLNVSGLTQSAALVSIGLLYLGSSKATLADIMVKELCGMKVTTVEDSSACREAYALSAGFAFGFIMLGKGAEGNSSQSDLNGGSLGLLKTFKSLILGEMNHSLPGDLKPRVVTDVNITSPAATIALSLMFLRTERKDVADLLEIPENIRKLDYVRSDLILLRMLGKCLIMWESVNSSKDWVESHLPKFIVDGVKNETKIDSEIDIARWNIIAGACFGIGLKFAGTARKEAHVTLIHYLDRLTRAAYLKASTVPGKIKRHAIRCCLSVVAVALAMVMAGTGELNVLRRLRIAHGHFSEGVTYGTHLSSHMALGLLFLGEGRYTLGTSNAAIAALVIAFYPSFPATPLENRAHLQAYRHLWTLAVEPRCLIAKDVDTGESAFLPIRLRLKEKGDSTLRALELVAPTLIPEIRLIESIQIDSPRYWPFSLHLANNPNHLNSFLKTGTVFVKRRTGHLSYSQDPRGNKSIFTRSKSETGSSVFDFGEVSKMLATPTETNLRDFISSFEDEGASMASVNFLCPRIGAVTEFEAFCASVLLECFTKDKPDSIILYLSVFYAVTQLSNPLSLSSLIGLEQIRFILEFYQNGIYERVFKNKHKSSISREPLLQKNLIDHVGRKIRGIPQTESGQRALRDYLRHAIWPASRLEAKELAAWLSIYLVPSLSILENLSEKSIESKLDRESLELMLKGASNVMIAGGLKGWSDEFVKELVVVLFE